MTLEEVNTIEAECARIEKALRTLINQPPLRLLDHAKDAINEISISVIRLQGLASRLTQPTKEEILAKNYGPYGKDDERAKREF